MPTYAPNEMSSAVALPETIKVLERGWLSANNILLRGHDGNALVDSGYVTHAPQTIALVKHALAGAPLARLINTHCHADHMGGNAALQREYACRTSLPAGEAPLIERWDEEALLLSYADQRAERFRIDDTFSPGDVLRLGELDWQVLAAPGHDPHATMLYSLDARILISGDALWENGFGVLFPHLTGRATTFTETRQTLESISRLDVSIVIPGHGRIFTDVDVALERAFSRLRGFEEDTGRLARHCAKALLMFSLLHRRSMPLARLADYVDEVPILRDLNRRFFSWTAEHYATWLIDELERARAVKQEDGRIVPLVTA
jgi:glyoxylase-like metal-dependent hydrolase (beta-lactamase superfamily II)